MPPTVSSYASDNITYPQSAGPQLTVNVGEIDFGLNGDDNALYLDGDPSGNSIFTDYQIMNRYEDDQHRYMLGVTAPNGFRGSTVAFCQLAAPTILWIADWTACRFGKVPDVPDPFSVSSQWVLLDMQVEVASPVFGPDANTPLNRISGYYVFGCQNPSSDFFPNISIPIPAWMKDSPTIPSVISLTDLRRGLIERNTTQGGTIQPPRPTGPTGFITTTPP